MSVCQILRDGGIEANSLRIYTAQTNTGRQKALRGDVTTVPPAALSPELIDVRLNGQLSGAWRDKIASKESPNLRDPWGAINVNSGGLALGRYQMRRPALIDTGMMRRDGTWTGKYGVNDEREFLDNHEAQNAALEDYAPGVRSNFPAIAILLIHDTPSEEVNVLNMFPMRGSRI